MNYFIFSDLHGNEYVMDAVMKIINVKEPFGVIFLGDIFGYLYGQEACLENFKSLKNLIMLKGNHDQYYLDCLVDDELKKQLVLKYGISYKLNLSRDDINLIKDCPTKVELSISGKKILCVHGGLNDSLEERVYPNQVRDYFKKNKNALEKYDYILTGHTHYSFDIQVSEKTRWINPGSIGQPRDGKGFRYCMINFEKNEVVHKKISCDIKKIVSEIERKEISKENRAYLLTKFKGENK